jgi:hypothetical protein
MWAIVTVRRTCLPVRAGIVERSVRKRPNKDEGVPVVTDRPERSEHSAGSNPTPDRAAIRAADPSASSADPERDRRIRRARFLAELAEARELRKRVAPRRTRAAELHARVLRTFRY